MKTNFTTIASKVLGNKSVKMIAILLVAVLVVGFALTAYAKENTKNADTNEFVTVARGDITEKVSASGTVQAPTHIKLNFAPGSSGKLTSIRVKISDVVKAGDVLATLDDRTAQIQLANAQANLDSALAKLNQTKQGATMETVILQQSNVEKARVALEGAKTAYQNQEAIFNDRTQAYQQVVNAQNQVEQAQLQQRSAQATLDQAQVSLANAKKQLADLEAQPNSTNVTQAKAAVEQAQVALDQADYSYRAAQENFKLVQASYENRTQAKAQLDQAKNQMEQAQATYNSTVAQMNQALAPAARENIQMAEATVVQARIQVQQQRIALDNLIIKAPINGVITQVNGNVGELASASLPVVEINDSNTNIMHVMAEVSQNDIVKLQPGQQAEINTTALLDQTFVGEVLVVYPEAVTQNGITKYNVLLSVENSAGLLKSGLTVNVSIKVGSQSNVLYVPIQALKQLNGADGVYLADSSQKTNGGLRFQPVTIGLFGGEIVEITSGLQEGDQVVVSSLEDSSSKQGTPSIFG